MSTGKSSSQVALAEKIAAEAHAGQTRWGGEPYITHPAAVSATFSDPHHIAVAWLHDVVEDTSVTGDDLLSRGVDNAVVADVLVVTKQDGETYCQFIQRICESGSLPAIAVKLADIQHNLSDLKKGAMRDKYELAAAFLHRAMNTEPARSSTPA